MTTTLGKPQEKTLNGHESETGLKVLIAKFRRSNETEAKSPKTIVWYDEMLGVFLAYLESRHLGTYLGGFTIDTIRGYILYLQHKPRFEGHPRMPAQVGLLSPKTVQCHVRVLKAFSFRLQKEGYTPENQLQNLKMPRAPVRLVEPLTPAEIKKVTTTDLSSRNGVRSQAIVVLALDSGLRAGEIAGITVGQMNLAAGFIKVMGKGAKERVVPIGEVQVVKTSSHL